MLNINNLIKIDERAITNISEKYGYFPESRPIDVLLDYGLILLDKPPGPTSHEVASWVKKMLEIPKTGHSGTLDPGATGLLPMGLGEGTKALSVLLLGPKEYFALARIHSYLDKDKLQTVFEHFIGEIYQRPPQRSSVKRATRIRNIYELEILEQRERLLLIRILCQAGTYIRKLIYDIGEVLGPGATMIELRRTRVSNLLELGGLVRLHDLYDAYQLYKEKKDEDKLRLFVKPIESCLSGIKSIVIRDTTVDALCHGAPLAIPGIVAMSNSISIGEMVAIYTLKGEVVGLAEASMTSDQISQNNKGIACLMKRLIMKPNFYPKGWN